MQHNADYLLLFSGCFPVKGAARSLIVDIGRNHLFFISNHYYDILIDAKKRSWGDIIDEYDQESQAQLNQLVEFLEQQELAFWTDEPDRFPEIELQWDAPAVITNAIVDSDASSSHDWKHIFESLISLGCRDIQIRFFDQEDPAILEDVLQLLAGSYIKSVELFLKYRKEYTKRSLVALVERYTRIKTIIVHSSPSDKIVIHHGNGNHGQMGNVLMVTQPITSSDHCGFVNSNYFTYVNVKTFAEFKNYNSCLNRKIGIDTAGNIKNCPSLPKIYGNIRQDALEDVITDEFKEIWTVTKDQIEVCKVCEFRYICPDCRAFVKDPLSKPLKCSYDPYSAAWK